MTALWFAVAAVVFPPALRRFYRAYRAEHPHTHPRDVRVDLTRAFWHAAIVAVCWPAVGAWWLATRGVVWVAIRIVGRGVVTRHYRASRAAMWEECLDSTPPPPADPFDRVIGELTR